VAYNTTIASAKAVKEFKSLNIENAKIGIILNLTPSYPRSNNPADLKSANIADLLFNRSFLDPCVKGEYPEDLIKLIKENNLLPSIIDGDAELIKENVVQFLGLTWLHKSIVEGCNVKGYHMWTFIDNWSWSNAYKNRYGFIQLDLKTQKKILKKSAYWIKEVAKSNGF